MFSLRFYIAPRISRFRAIALERTSDGGMQRKFYDSCGRQKINSRAAFLG